MFVTCFNAIECNSTKNILLKQNLSCLFSHQHKSSFVTNTEIHFLANTDGSCCLELNSRLVVKFVHFQYKNIIFHFKIRRKKMKNPSFLLDNHQTCFFVFFFNKSKNYSKNINVSKNKFDVVLKIFL